jgi:hypothetical protein
VLFRSVFFFFFFFFFSRIIDGLEELVDGNRKA